MVTKRQIEKTTVYPVFSLFIQFSAIEIRQSFLTQSLWQVDCNDRKKRWGAHARWWALAIFQLTELNIKANPPCFSMYACTSVRWWRNKLCAVRMRNAKQGNDLKLTFIIFNLLPRVMVQRQLDDEARLHKTVQLSKNNMATSEWSIVLARWEEE